MSNDDLLFPAESVAMDSPRLAWLKANGFETQRLADGGTECPESGDIIPRWVCRVSKDDDDMSNYSPIQIAGGDTEDEACSALAAARKIKLWNEE